MSAASHMNQVPGKTLDRHYWEVDLCWDLDLYFETKLTFQETLGVAARVIYKC